MCNLYSITTNQEAIVRLFRKVSRYFGNLASMPGVFPDYPAPVIRNAGEDGEMLLMRWGILPPAKFGGPPVTNIRNPRRRTMRLAEAEKPLPDAVQQLRRIRARTEPGNNEERRGLVRPQ